MSERGESSLVGLLVASTLFLGVLGATLDMFGTSQRLVRDGGERSESQVRARAALDRLARELRNVEAPSAAAPLSLEVAGAYDVVFRVADSRSPNGGANVPNTRRVRWCLDTANRLWRAVQTWTTAAAPAAPAAGACPGAWPASSVVASDVVNRSEGLELFVFDEADPRLIGAVRAAVAVDADQRGGAPPTRLQSGVVLRNQDRPPTAAFTATVSGQGVITLNGSVSKDPENVTLQFEWKDGTTVLACKSVVCSYDPPGVAAARSLTLTVIDGAGLRHTAPAQVVTA